MPRLYRPYIPIKVRREVAIRQLKKVSEPWWAVGHSAAPLSYLLWDLAVRLSCKVEDLRLDHDPALATRRRLTLKGKIRYIPDANHPDFLIYRTKHGHHIKTNVRGDGAQYPDRVLIKRERKRREGVRAKPKPKRKWPSKKIPSRPFRTKFWKG